MRLLIIGALCGQFGAASKIAIDRGATVAHVDDVDSALAALRSGRGAELLMVDAAIDIATLIARLSTERICVPVVACGLGDDARVAVDAIRAGAKEYIPLPPDAELIAAVLAAVAEDSHQLIYADPATARVVKLAEQVARSEASILIAGESGTGKEVLARHIHRRSNRATKPFVSINCAAIPEQLLESELFGHEKGAFTGAVARRIGKFEEADGGTLLLDEISEMDVRLQAKLLRAIQEREIDRVGGLKPVKVDIRILATTNRDLAREVEKGTFREDLLYRLNVMTLTLPPLRDRPADILDLAKHFAHKYAELNGVEDRPLSEESRRVLLNHGWKGNVRELENTVHRAVLLASGPEIGPEAVVLPNVVGSGPSAVQPGASASASVAGGDGTAGLVGRTVADVERDLILDTLGHCLGNRTHAANILGISIRTLRNKLRQYGDEGISVPLPGSAELRGAA